MIVASSSWLGTLDVGLLHRGQVSAKACITPPHKTMPLRFQLEKANANRQTPSST